jgi:hypothetical protein
MADRAAISVFGSSFPVAGESLRFVVGPDELARHFPPCRLNADADRT